MQLNQHLPNIVCLRCRKLIRVEIKSSSTGVRLQFRPVEAPFQVCVCSIFLVVRQKEAPKATFVHVGSMIQKQFNNLNVLVNDCHVLPETQTRYEKRWSLAFVLACATLKFNSTHQR